MIMKTSSDVIHRPVEECENEEVDGLALCCEKIYEDRRRETADLRERQAAYLASLPTDPAECLRAARAILHPDGHPYPGHLKETYERMLVISELLKTGDFDSFGLQRALAHLADDVANDLRGSLEALRRLSDILAGPTRAEMGP